MMTNISSKTFSSRFFCLLLVTGMLFSCSKEEQVQLLPSDISGNIYIRAGTQTDSDINDPNHANVSNNSLDTAQNLPNPVELGGYVSLPLSGDVQGSLYTSGDQDDFYSIYLISGSIVSFNALGGNVTFFVTEPNSTTPVDSGNQFTASVAGTHILHIQANQGASNYTLKVTSPTVATALNANAAADFVPGEIIVRYKDAKLSLQSKSASQSLLDKTKNMGFKVKAGHPSRDMLLSMSSNRALVRSKLNIAQAVSLKQETLNAIAALKKQADVADAQPNYIYHASAVPNDSYHKYMWNYQLINLESAWDISRGENPVVVAVLDTGLLKDHEDIAGKFEPGYDFIRDTNRSNDGDGIDPDPQDPGDNPPNSSFHGTHVSGTIGAATSNGIGISAAGWDVRVMPLRVLGINGGTEYDIEQAILYAIGEPNDSGTTPTNPAQVINLSLGRSSANLTVPRAYQLALQKNVFVVAAAGNDSKATPIPYSPFPAGLPGVISVGAVGSDKKVADYSNYGRFLSLAAPGGDASGIDRNGDGYADFVLSLGANDGGGSIKNNLYSFKIGTSMASPHVAAVVALMKSVYPDMTLSEFQDWLSSGLITEDLPPLGRDDKSGYGLIDAYKAVKLAYDTANGVTPPQPVAVLSINPASLDFGSTENSLKFQISNLGSAPLNVSSVTTDQPSWSTISKVNVDVNGVGEYLLSIDRNQLASLQYSGLISVNSDGGNGTLFFTVTSQPMVDNAGPQYVQLTNLTNPSSTYTVQATYLNGSYSYAFSGIPPGSYKVGSYSNLDYNDITACNNGESCGVYTTTSTEINIINVQPGRPITGVNFYTGFFSSNASTTLDLNKTFYLP